MTKSTAKKPKYDFHVLDQIQRRVLWLATRITDHANRDRPKTDGMKVGGHQASSASMVSLMTALWMCFLRREDRVSVKPHASPVLHALWYLLGRLDASYLTELRSFGGLQAYPSRTKDPDRVDFSTGSMGFGAVAPLFAAVTRRYLAAHGHQTSDGRFIALIGDAELDEGNVWEALFDPVTDGLKDVLWVVDLNRQSLDRVVPGIKAARWRSMFASNGWNVIDAKYGRRLEEAFAIENGELLRRLIDDMSNEEYQSLFGLSGGALRDRLLEGADPALKALIKVYDDEELNQLVTDLGGHDLSVLSDAYETALASEAPAVIFAYTVKGWGLPIAGDPLNHSALLTGEHIDEFRQEMGLTEETEWSRFEEDSPEGRWCAQVGEALEAPEIPAVPEIDLPTDLNIKHRKNGSTQSAFGLILSRLSDSKDVADRVVTTAPDVSISTNLAGWINKRGVFAPGEEPVPVGGLIKWAPSPSGQHLELGISEMNLFALLGELGLAHELSGNLLFPIGTVYDPFVCRGLDAFIHSLYSGARFIIVGTPSGITLSPEGGAHQSTITPSIGIGLPGVDSLEPAYAKAFEWMLCDALGRLTDRGAGRSTYFRLTTRQIDQDPFEQAREDQGDSTLRQNVLAGAYLLSRADEDSEYVVNLAASGAVMPEVIQAAESLYAEDIDTNILDITSVDRLHQDWVNTARISIRQARSGSSHPHLERLLPAAHRTAPFVTVHDATPHSLAWIGSIFGAPVVPLGVHEFGQSGTIPDLYENFTLGADHIVNAAVLAMERGDTESGS